MVILDLVRAVGALPEGGVVEVAITHPGDLELARRWAERTGNTVVTAEPGGAGSETTAHGSVLVRRGRTPDPALTLGADRMPGARLWIYTNFHCNLACDYCCVASSPRAAKRELDVEVISRLAVQAADWGVQELYLTGGEPFLRRDIAEIVGSCTAALPTTMLTNGMLFRGLGLRTLQAMPRTGFALQISVDSATPEVHDAHRGAGSWARAVDGIRTAIAEGFRVRVAATISTPTPDALRRFRQFLDTLGIPPADQVIRPVALQGAAASGVRLTRETLVPEVTVTEGGIYWHPVAATDERALVTRQIEPLAPVLDEVSTLFAQQWAATSTATSLFPCA